MRCAFCSTAGRELPRLLVGMMHRAVDEHRVRRVVTSDARTVDSGEAEPCVPDDAGISLCDQCVGLVVAELVSKGWLPRSGARAAQTSLTLAALVFASEELQEALDGVFLRHPDSGDTDVAMKPSQWMAVQRARERVRVLLARLP